MGAGASSTTLNDKLTSATPEELVSVLRDLPASENSRIAAALEATADDGAAEDGARHVDPNAPPFYPVAPEDGELDKISCVTERLYLANWRGADDREKRKELAITHIVAVGTEFVDDDEHGASYWKKDITDDESSGEDMGASLRDAAGFIHNAISGGGRCLVHCAAGISRSATCVLAYLLLHTERSLRDAFALVIAARRPIWPNDGFMRALIALETAHRKPAPPSITIDEYTEWGDYEPPEPEEDTDTRSALPRFQRGATFVVVKERLKKATSEPDGLGVVAAAAMATAAITPAALGSQGSLGSLLSGASPSTSTSTDRRHSPMLRSPLSRSGRHQLAREASDGVVTGRKASSSPGVPVAEEEAAQEEAATAEASKSSPPKPLETASHGATTTK